MIVKRRKLIFKLMLKVRFLIEKYQMDCYAICVIYNYSNNNQKFRKGVQSESSSHYGQFLRLENYEERKLFDA